MTREMVPVGPFRDWLADRVRLDEDGATARCEALGIGLRGARRVLDDAQTVTVDLVDRVLLEDGTTTLQDLYPALYCFEGAVA